MHFFPHFTFLIKGSFDHFWSVLFQRVHMCVFHRYTVFVLVTWWLISSCRKWRKWCRVIRSYCFLISKYIFLCSFCSSALQCLYSLYKLFLSITRKLFLQLKPAWLPTAELNWLSASQTGTSPSVLTDTDRLWSDTKSRSCWGVCFCVWWSITGVKLTQSEIQVQS